MKINLYCVFREEEDTGELTYIAAFSDIDELDEYLFEHEFETLLVETTTVNVPTVEDYYAND